MHFNRLIQRGNFTVANFSEIESLPSDEQGMKDIIKLHYMGKIEFEGRAIPISRMIIEYYNDSYEFYPTGIYSKDNEEMYLYFNSEYLNNQPNDYIKNLANLLYENVYSIYEYAKKTKESSTNFWWDIDSDYFIFFGEEKKEIIKYFLEMCMQRDGTKEEIKTKLKTIGCKIN